MDSRKLDPVKAYLILICISFYSIPQLYVGGQQIERRHLSAQFFLSSFCTAFSNAVRCCSFLKFMGVPRFHSSVVVIFLQTEDRKLPTSFQSIFFFASPLRPPRVPSGRYNAPACIQYIFSAGMIKAIEAVAVYGGVHVRTKSQHTATSRLEIGDSFHKLLLLIKGKRHCNHRLDSFLQHKKKANRLLKQLALEITKRRMDFSFPSTFCIQYLVVQVQVLSEWDFRRLASIKRSLNLSFHHFPIMY